MAAAPARHSRPRSAACFDWRAGPALGHCHAVQSSVGLRHACAGVHWVTSTVPPPPPPLKGAPALCWLQVARACVRLWACQRADLTQREHHARAFAAGARPPAVPRLPARTSDSVPWCMPLMPAALRPPRCRCITKLFPTRSHTVAAQGGINAALGNMTGSVAAAALVPPAGCPCSLPANEPHPLRCRAGAIAAV